MPALVRLYIRNVIIGFALSVVFVGALLGLNVANLWHLVSTSQNRRTKTKWRAET